MKTNPCVERFDRDHRDCPVCEGFALMKRGEAMIMRGLRERRERKVLEGKLTTVRRQA